MAGWRRSNKMTKTVVAALRFHQLALTKTKKALVEAGHLRLSAVAQEEIEYLNFVIERYTKERK